MDAIIVVFIDGHGRTLRQSGVPDTTRLCRRRDVGEDHEMRRLPARPRSAIAFASGAFPSSNLSKGYSPIVLSLGRRAFDFDRREGL